MYIPTRYTRVTVDQTGGLCQETRKMAATFPCVSILHNTSMSLSSVILLMSLACFGPCVVLQALRLCPICGHFIKFCSISK